MMQASGVHRLLTCWVILGLGLLRCTTSSATGANSFGLPLKDIFQKLQGSEFTVEEQMDLQEHLADMTSQRIDHIHDQNDSSSEAPNFDWENAIDNFKAQVALVRQARELRKEGNACLKDHDTTSAARKYGEAISLLQSSKVFTSATNRSVDSCLLNLALCHLKKNECHEAVRVCSEILERDPAKEVHVKTLHRRSKAYAKLGELESAKADLEEANGIDPSDRKVVEDLRAAGGVPIEIPTSTTLSPFSLDNDFFSSFANQGGFPPGASPFGAGAGAGPADPLFGMGNKLLSALENPDTLEFFLNLAKSSPPSYISQMLNIPEYRVGMLQKWVGGFTVKDIQRLIGNVKFALKIYRGGKRISVALRPFRATAKASLMYYMLYKWVVLVCTTWR